MVYATSVPKGATEHRLLNPGETFDLTDADSHATHALGKVTLHEEGKRVGFQLGIPYGRNFLVTTFPISDFPLLTISDARWACMSG